MNTFADRLDYLIKQEGLKITTFARLSTLSRNSVYSWINGATPDNANMKVLVDFFVSRGYNADWVRDGKGPVKNYQNDSSTTNTVSDIEGLYNKAIKNEKIELNAREELISYWREYELIKDLMVEKQANMGRKIQMLLGS